MKKAEIIAKVCQEIRTQFERMWKAAQSSQEYATDKDSKAESKYDTRSLEASYLAAGQAEKADELAAALAVFEEWNPPEFDEDEAIDVGALVEADLEGDLVFYLVAPAGGGIVSEHEGCDLTVLTPDSALGAKLMGLRAGDALDEPDLTVFTVG